MDCIFYLATVQHFQFFIEPRITRARHQRQFTEPTYRSEVKFQLLRDANLKTQNPPHSCLKNNVTQHFYCQYCGLFCFSKDEFWISCSKAYSWSQEESQTRYTSFWHFSLCMRYNGHFVVNFQNLAPVHYGKNKTISKSLVISLRLRIMLNEFMWMRCRQKSSLRGMKSPTNLWSFWVLRRIGWPTTNGQFR